MNIEETFVYDVTSGYIFIDDCNHKPVGIPVPNGRYSVVIGKDENGKISILIDEEG